MAPPIPIPAEVRAWLTGVFGSCNAQVANLITDVPTTHETAVDMAFIQSFSHVSAPYRFPSGWTVELSTHYLGGGRHWSAWPDQPPRWEIADIGLLVMYRQDGKLLRSKVALLQSKRLYPDELEWDEDSALDYMIGFRRLFPDEGQWSAVTAPRPFSFTEQSRYKALVTGVNQYRVIEDYESQRGIPVYYLLYNPVRLPSTVVFPISAGQQRAPSPCDVGARVVPAVQVRAVMTDKPIGSSPSYDDLCASLQAPFVSEGNRGGWRLEHFVVDLLLDCETGYVANSPDDAGLDYVFNRRTGPISAAVAVTLDAPA